MQVDKEELESNPALFARVICDRDWEVKDFHAQWMHFQANNPFTVVLAPRGWGKSEFADIFYVLWRLVQDRNKTFSIVSKSMGAATDILKKISNLLTQNEVVKYFWGNFSSPALTWNQRQITVSGRTKIIKDPTVYVTGAGGQMASYHSNEIIVDDSAVEENSRTAESRDSLIQWFGNTLQNATTAEHAVHVVGTRYHQDELYGHCINLPNFKTLITDCYIENDKGVLTSRWPSKWSDERLKLKRVSIGERNFNLQFRNNANLVTGGVFKAEWIDNNRYRRTDKAFKDALPKLVEYQGIDIAIGTKQMHDYFVIITIGYDHSTDHFWVLDMHRDRCSPTQHLTIVKRNFQKWNVNQIVVESNAYQKALQVLLKDSGLPAVAQVTTKDKETRMYSIQGIFEAGMVHIPYDPKFQPLVDELKGFPSKQMHDDTCDALELVITHCRKKAYVGSIDLDPMAGF